MDDTESLRIFFPPSSTSAIHRVLSVVTQSILQWAMGIVHALLP